MSRLPLYLLLLGMCLGCADAGVGPPPVDLDRLAPALADMQLVEALTSEIPVVIRDSIKEEFQINALKPHGMTPEEFEEMHWQVRQEPVWVDSLYTRVGTLLARRSADLLD